jgi:putative DNA primase/helicase
MNGDVIDESLNLFKKRDEMNVVHPETGETVRIRAYPYIAGGENRGMIFYEPTRWPCPDNAIGFVFCGNCKSFDTYTESSVKNGEETLPPGIVFDDLDKIQTFIGDDKEKHKERVIAYCTKAKIKISYDNSACDHHSKFNEPPPDDELFEINKIRSDLTDIGNGQRLSRRHGKDLKYCHIWAKWLVWDGKRWDMDGTAEVERRAKETVFSIYTEASNELLKKKDRDNIIQHAQRSESNRALKAMLEMASSEYGIVVRQESLDNDKYKINLHNYTLDLKDLKHYEHNREDLLTKIANVDYNLDAECPKWREFLNLIFNNDQETIKYVQKACGYSLSGDIGEQKVFFLCGNGENGKSTFLDTIMAILGDYAMSCPTETFMVKDFGGNGPNNDLARLKGARFVTAAEIEAGKKLAESLVKQVTGGDKIAARYLRQEYFEFTPEFKLWFCTNHKPDITGTDHGIWRRVKIIPFDIIVPKKLQELGRPAVKNYHEIMIKEEASGILNWMLQGWILWMREGLKDSEAIKEATNE